MLYVAAAFIVVLAVSTQAAPISRNINTLNPIRQQDRKSNETLLPDAQYFTKGSPSYKICGNKKDDETRLKITEISIDPDPPKKGQKLTISMDMKPMEVISSGNIIVNLSYGSISIVDETLDLCDLITEVGKKCPIKDEFKFTLKETLPDYIPSGEYEGKVIGTDQNGNELLCFDLKLKI